ncbi:MAG TPA: hypothetical protein VHX16_12735 [Chloroflexota bacterium]|jgi:enamine deaminase RidA (YjgF/YER057c/UK114 family)|nr:hypothetical protein [Chloroflexota bacterium]
MHLTVTNRHDHEIVALCAEGRAGPDADEQTRDIFRRFDGALSRLSLSLDDTVRTRLWARDRPSRDVGSKARVDVLSGAARSASSSFIAPDYFESDADVAVELWALRPASPDSQKKLIEYEPPIVPLRYLERDGLVVLSGMTSVLTGLDKQVGEILGNVSSALEHAGVEWNHVVKLSAVLHSSQSLDHLRDVLDPLLMAQPEETEFLFADGYSTEGKLVEIEVTARREVRG